MLIATTLRSTFIKLPPKTVKYKSYKNFNETVFLQKFEQKLIQGDFYSSDDLYLNLWSNGLVVKALDSQSRGPVFKTAGWLQGRLSLSSSRGR